MVAAYDIIIKGGTIIDGTRTPRYVSDLAIRDGKIVQIGGLKGAQASRVLDATGMIVAPGVVDLHTHYDAQIFWDPYCTLSGWHGVTSVAIGNCGFGFAPCRAEDRDRAMLTLTRNEAIPYEAMKAGMPWNWTTFPEFLDSLDRTPKGVNVLSYVPLTPLYVWTMGIEEAKRRRPNDAELKKMQQLVHEGMNVGACGWSAQVLGPTSLQRDYDGTPMITDLMAEREILAFGEALGQRDEGFIELTYRLTGEEGQPLDAESAVAFERLAKVSGRPILYQTVRANSSNPKRHRERLKWLEECSNRGLRVYGQGSIARGDLEGTLEDWNLFDDSPIWREVTLGTPAQRKAKMSDPEIRRQLRDEYDSGYRPGAGVGIAESLGSFIIHQVADQRLKKYEGKRVEDIAKEENRHVVDAFLELCISDNLKTEFVAKRAYDDPNYTAEVLNSPYVIAGLSDGGAHVRFSTGGSYPTQLLTWLVRDNGLMSLEEAHFKLSYLPAFMGGFRDRGFLREGAPADVIVYDLEKLDDGVSEIAYDLPGGEWRRVQRGRGYHWVLVNGQVTFEDGQSTGNTPGKLLRHGRAD